MLREILYHNTELPEIKRGLDAFAARHRAIATNLANVEVVGFERREVEFETRMRKAMGEGGEIAATHPQHFPQPRDPRDVVHYVDQIPLKDDEKTSNNVDIDTQVTQLATNQIQYSVTLKAARHLFQMVRKTRGMG
ncbi:flagellar basal body rod protein FlgB [bacterium]|nr:flagellar basal body rod protein FlgB [bacterium]